MPSSTAPIIAPPPVTSTLYSSEKYSDLVIVCRGKISKVHRAVVCLQSKPPAAATDGKFKEASTVDIVLDDNEPEIVECMLKFLYTSNYSDGRAVDKPNVTPDTRLTTGPSTRSSLSSPSRSNAGSKASGPLVTNVMVKIIADLFDIQGLKELAKNKYGDALLDDWNSASFVASLKLLYEEPVDADRPLKDTAIRAAGDHLEELVDQGDFVALCTERERLLPIYSRHPWEQNRNHVLPVARSAISELVDTVAPTAR